MAAASHGSEQRRASLSAMLNQTAPNSAEDVDLFGMPISIEPSTGSVVVELDACQRRERILAALLRPLEGLVAMQPVFCIFEDVHWADPTTLEFVDRIVQQLESLRALVVLTFRPEFQPAWSGQALVTMLVLNRMSRRNSQLLVEHVVGGADLDPDLVTRIVQRSDGVPLFIEELTRAVTETRRTGHGSAIETEIPISLRDSLTERLDRLSAGKPLAQIGSTIGRTFSKPMLEAVATTLGLQPATGLAELEQAGLIFSRGEGHNITFKHALVQDVAYESLLRSRRRELDGRIAEVLETQLAQQTQPEVLAHHHVQAQNWLQAGQCFHDAGARAIARGAAIEAITNLERALEVLATYEDPARSAELDVHVRCRYAEVLSLIERLAEARATLEDAEGIAARYGLTAEHSRICYMLGNVCFPLGELDECFAQHERALQLARESGTAECEALALGGLGDACYARGRIVSARRYFARCVEVSNERGLRRSACAHRGMLGAMMSYELRPAAALEHIQLALAEAQQLGRKREEMLARICLLYFSSLYGRAVEEELFVRTNMLATQIGARRSLIAAAIYQAQVLIANGDRVAALSLLEQKQFLNDSVAPSFNAARWLGVAALAETRPKIRRRLLAEAETIIERGCLAHNHLVFYPHAMMVTLDLGEWDETERYAHALELFTREESLPWSEYWCSWGRALATYGRNRAANEELTATIGRLRQQALEVRLQTALSALEAALASQPVRCI